MDIVLYIVQKYVMNMQTMFIPNTHFSLQYHHSAVSEVIKKPSRSFQINLLGPQQKIKPPFIKTSYTQANSYFNHKKNNLMNTNPKHVMKEV